MFLSDNIALMEINMAEMYLVDHQQYLWFSFHFLSDSIIGLAACLISKVCQ
jgi:hypothetical protein